MKNKMEDLRNHLFVTLEELLDKDHPLEIERAIAVAKTAQVLVNSAKVEVDYLKIAGGEGTGFIEKLPAPSGSATRVRRIK